MRLHTKLIVLALTSVALAAASCHLRVRSNAPITPPKIQRYGSTKPSDPQVEAAYRYLDGEMDRWTDGTWVYGDRDDGAAGFFPAFMGDSQDIKIEHASAGECCNGTAGPELGDTCLKITYGARGPKRWAGIYWMYPDIEGGNWGQKPGRSLVGATKLTLWARGNDGYEVVEMKIGGVNRHPHHRDEYKYQDSFGPVNTEPSPRKALTRAWRKFEIAVPKGADLRSVIGGFAFVESAAYNPNGATVYLDDIRYDNADRNQLRFIRSYTRVPGANDEPALRNAAFLYDNVLVLLAYIASDNPTRLRRAQRLADAIVFALEHDRYWHGREARWRNAYSCGPLENPEDHTARLPGWYEPDAPTWVQGGMLHGEWRPAHCKHGRWLEDLYAASTDTGNTAWAMIGLVASYQAFGDRKYLEAAKHAADWIERSNLRADDRLGGYRGGFTGWEPSLEMPNSPKPIEWRSFEHNLDLYVAFTQLAQVTGDETYRDRAAYSRRFLFDPDMWNEADGHYWTGTGEGNEREKVSHYSIPQDIQAWSVLSLWHERNKNDFRRKVDESDPPVPRCLRWMEKNCEEKCFGFQTYKFSKEGWGAWLEGAAHAAAAYRYIGNETKANQILDDVDRANAAIAGTHPNVPQGAVFSACGQGGADTKFGMLTLTTHVPCPPTQAAEPYWDWDKTKTREYPELPHIGATAAYILARRGVNLYWPFGSPETSAH